MKKAIKIIPAIFLLLSSFSTAFIVNNIDKAESPVPVEAATYSSYKVKVRIDVVNDADYWYEARILYYTKPEQGRGSEHHYRTSEEFSDYISYDGGSYTTNEVDCGTEFPTTIGLYTDVGFWLQYHWGSSNLTVFVNGINVASGHVEYGGWDNNMETHYLNISDNKYPYPVEKKINVDYLENVDPHDESTQQVTISATDQYGVKWTQPSSSPISLVNESYPGSDTATMLDNSGMKWRINSTLESNHYSTYVLKIPTASTIYPTVEKSFTVQFAFPLHLSIMVDNKLALKLTGVAGDVVVLPTNDLETPTGYYIANYKKTSGMGSITQDPDNKEIYRFTYIGGDATVTATLKPITYIIRFNQNGTGVSGTLVDKKVTYNSKNSYLPMNRFVRKDYTFLGWNTKADGTGTSFANQALIPNLTSTKDEVIIFYAQWQSNNPSVTASLFTDGNFGLILGGVIVGAAAGIVGTYLFLKRKKEQNALKG